MPSADAQESLYLPSLDQCLNRRVQIISWKTAFDALTHPQGRASQSRALQPFLSEQRSIHALANCLKPHTPGNAQTKGDFETRTSSINVPPADNDQYDIQQIKDDVTWLSQHAKIDEVTALRVVILEWQDRGASQILEGYTEEEAIGLQQATAGSANFGASSYASLARIKSSSSSSLVTDKGLKSYNAPQRRRSRLLRTLTGEEEGLLAVAVHLEASLRIDEGDQNTPVEANGHKTIATAWIRQIAASVAESRLGSLDLHKTLDSFLQHAVAAFRTRANAMEKGQDWDVDGDLISNTDLELHHSEHQLTQLLQILHLVFAVFSGFESSQLPNALAVRSWYSAMDEFGFCQAFQAFEPSQQHVVDSLKVMASICSVQILQIGPITDILFEEDPDSHSSSSYIHDPDCIRHVTQVCLAAADSDAAIAAPAIFAWGIIARSIAGETESRRRLSLDSEDPNFGSSPRTSSAEAPRHLSDAMQALSDASPDLDVLETLLKQSVDGLGAYRVIENLAALMDQSLGPAFPSYTIYIARKSLLSLLRRGCEVSIYNEDLLNAVVTTLQPPGVEIDTSHSHVPDTFVRLANTFLEDEILISTLYQVAASRYPFETAPFLRLSQILSSSTAFDQDQVPVISQYLRSLQKFTQRLPLNFSGFEAVDDAVNCIRLTQDLLLFESQKTQQSSGGVLQGKSTSLVASNTDQVLFIPKGTIGLVLEESKPFIVTWDHDHSAFSYLASALSASLPSSNRIDGATRSPLDTELQTAVVNLFAKQVQAARRMSVAGTDSEASSLSASQILQEASDHLPADQDIVTVISDTFQERLFAQQQDQASVDLLTSCISFFDVALGVVPNRVWPLLARSGLLNVDGRGGELARIVTSVELGRGRFDFLLECLRLYRSLVGDIISNAISRTTTTKAVANRFEDVPDLGTGVPRKTLSKILCSFTGTFIDVLQTSSDWRFADRKQSLELHAGIVEVFERIFVQCYAFDDTSNPSNKPAGALAASAKLILDNYLGDAASEASVNPLVKILSVSADTRDVSFAAHEVQLSDRQTSSLLHFLVALLEISKVRHITPSCLQRQLFRAVPLLIRIFANGDSHKRQTYALIAEMVQTAGHNDKSHPSLLGNLGTDISQVAVTVLSNPNAPLLEIKTETEAWRFFSAAISNRQQWFATYLLTATIPKASSKQKSKCSSSRNSTKPALELALDALSKIQNFESDLALAQLGFVSNALDHWPWCFGRIRSHASFIERISAQCKEDNLVRVPLSESHEDIRSFANQTLGVSMVHEILAMYVHNMRKAGDDTIDFVKSLVKNLGHLARAGVSNPEYNKSLHANLSKNFETKFPGCRLSNFKKLLGPVTFGSSYYYDLQCASDMLSWSPAWKSGNAKHRGFEEDFVRANKNFSMVEAQRISIMGWKILATELSKDVVKDTGLQKRFCYLVNECLQANRDSDLQGDLSDRLNLARAELALNVLQRLVDCRTKVQSMDSLLGEAWNVIIKSGVDFDSPFAGTGVPYYRILLRVLFLSLQPFIYMNLLDADLQDKGSPARVNRWAPQSAFSRGQILVEVAGEVIARGFRSLASQLQDEPESVTPADFALITSILQSMLQVQGAEANSTHSQIALRLAEQSTSRYATALFSWSDRLTATNNDPVYGELSIFFLVELSSLPLLAQQLATDGLLSQLNTVNLMAYFRRSGGTGPFEEPTRVSKIWSRGILPLCLNLLVGTGEPFAAEVATFLNNFSEQLKRGAEALDANAAPKPGDPTAGCITLNTACEAQSMALLTVALDRCRNSPSVQEEVPELEWDRAGVKDDLETWLHGSRKALRERIVPTTEREVALQRTRITRDGCCDEAMNRLEQQVVAELEGALFCLSSS